MARRKLIPLTYRGRGIITTGRTAFFEYDSGAMNTPRYEPVFVERIGRFPGHVREQPEGKVFPLTFVIKVCDSQQQFEAITKIFNPELGLQTLRLEDLRRQRYRLQCVPQQAILEQPGDHPIIVPLWAPEPYLEDDDESTAIVEIPTGGNPASLSIRNNGTAAALPILEVIPRQLRTTAQGYRTVREITYANRSEFPLTGPGSGTWMLMVIGSWDTAALIAAGQMQASGADIAVFVDNVQVPPEKVTISGINTTTTKVWIEISDSPAQFATLQASIVAGTTIFDFENADHGFRVGDYLVWQNTALAYESAKITAINGDSVTVQRSARNTTAGSSATGTKLYRSGHHIQLAYNWSNAPARPPNPDNPLISTSLSTNLKWDWPIGPIWPDRNRRAGGWRRILYDGREDIPELKKNRLSVKTTLDIVPLAEIQSPINPGDYNRQENDVRFTDLEPTASKPNFDALEFRACCGVDDILGAIEYDSAIGWPFCMQVIGRDLLGLDTVLFNNLGHETSIGTPLSAHFPPSLDTNRQETPPGILSAVIFRARNCIVTASLPSDDIEEEIVGALAVGHDLQGLHLDEITQIIGLVTRFRASAGTATVALSLIEIASGSILLGGTPGAGTPGEAIAGPFSGGGSTYTSFHWVCTNPGQGAAFNRNIPVLLPGDYFFSTLEPSPGGGTTWVPKSDATIYPHGSHWEYDGAVFIRNPNEDIWAAILSLQADNQEDTLTLDRTEEQVLLRNITIIFDPARTPIVDPRAAENAYYFNDEWIRGTDTVELRYLKRWVEAQNNIISIDTKERTVTDIQLDEEIRQTLTVAGDPWLRLQPGNNTVTIEAVGGAVEEDHTVRWRHTWQA